MNGMNNLIYDYINAAKGLLDAANVDIKFFNDASYRRICGGTLEPVLEAVKLFYKNGVHLELTTLLIDEYNNNDEEIKKIADFIVSVDSSLPWHISRFFPLYKMQDGRVTEEETIINAYNIGKSAGLSYIYAGNIRLNGYEESKCGRGKDVYAGRIFVDGKGIGDVGAHTLKERAHLSENGMIIVQLVVDSKTSSIISGPDIVSKGFVFEDYFKELNETLHKLVMNVIEENQKKEKENIDWVKGVPNIGMLNSLNTYGMAPIWSSCP